MMCTVPNEPQPRPDPHGLGAFVGTAPRASYSTSKASAGASLRFSLVDLHRFGQPAPRPLEAKSRTRRSARRSRSERSRDGAEGPVLHCLDGESLLLTGFPGTGKTRMAKKIVEALREAGGKVQKGTFLTMEAVEGDVVRLESGQSFAGPELLKHTRLCSAITYASVQDDVESPHFTLKHLWAAPGPPVASF
eukprot:s5904_g1.t1